MIESKYNYYTQDGDKMICLNGISKMVFSVPIDTFNFIKEILADEDKQAQEPAITERLVEMHFLVNDNKQEIDTLLENKRKDANSSIYQLILNPTQDCIFRCWYCYETHRESKMSDTTIDNIKKLVIKVLDREDIDRIMIGWFGGEPLMYFDDIVYPLSIFIKKEAEKRNKSFSCNMTTNGFLLTTEVVRKCSLINLNLLQITLDGDENNHNKTRNKNGEPSFEKIVDNCIDLCSYLPDNRLALRINYTDKIIQTDFAKVLEVIPENIRPQIDVMFKRVWQTYDKKVQKTPLGLLSNVEKLKKMNFGYNYETDFSFIGGCLCYADRNNYVNLNFDGKAYRCTAEDYNSCNALGYLNDDGDIIWENETVKSFCSKPYIEDTKCMECNLLPICGGPCFKRKYQYITNKTDFCMVDKLDTDLDHFVREYYGYVQKKKHRILEV